MSQLYTNLAAVYDAMYQTFINYEDEFAFYNSIRTKYRCSKVLEAGCGTGKLALPFLNSGAFYSGFDLSGDMLAIARTHNSGVQFFCADMRDFTVSKPVDFCFAAARTVSYLVTDKDVQHAFRCMAAALEKNGILCFDFIDAARFIPLIQNGYDIVHTATYGTKQYSRTSRWTIHNAKKNTFNWGASYYEITQNGKRVFIGGDKTVLRTFTADNITLFLSACGMEVVEWIDKPSYAFDTLVVVAKKV